MIARIALAVAVLAAGCGRSNFDSDARDAPGNGDTGAGAHNIAFVTSTSHVPSTLGADFVMADGICNARAASAGLPGTYVAFLSTTAVDARDRLAGARGWVRVDGEPLFDLPADIGTGAVLHPLNVDELGGTVSASLVITGSEGTGVENTQNCFDFTSGAASVNVGSTAGTTTDWLATGAMPCTQAAPIYCFGTDLATPLPIVPVVGRRIFVSVQPYLVDGTGLAKADGLCASEATLAGLTGSYKALLATTAASALSRFNLAGPPWVRLDGITVAQSSLDFGAGKLLTTPNVTSSKTYLGNELVLVGAISPVMLTAIASDSCQDWTTAGPDGRFGFANQLNRYFNGGISSCNRSIYCLEDL